MKSKPPFERSPGAGWGGIAARQAARIMTRRSALCRLGYAAAALLGARFLVADGPRALVSAYGDGERRCVPTTRSALWSGQPFSAGSRRQWDHEHFS